MKYKMRRKNIVQRYRELREYIDYLCCFYDNEWVKAKQDQDISNFALGMTAGKINLINHIKKTIKDLDKKHDQ